MSKPDKPNDASLRPLIEASGLTPEEFADKILIARGRATLYRWLKRVPPRVRRWLRLSFRRIERHGDDLHIVIYAPPTAELYDEDDQRDAR